MTWFVTASLSALEFVCMCITCLLKEHKEKCLQSAINILYIPIKLLTCVLSLGRLMLLNQAAPGTQLVPQEMIRHCSVLVYLIFFSYTAIDNNVKCDTDIVHNLM